MNPKSKIQNPKSPSLPVRMAAMLLFVAAPTLAQSPPADWLELVPPDAQLYVEFRNLLAIQSQLGRLGVWTAINTLSEQADDTPTSQAWQRRSRNLLGMTPEEAVSMVLGSRTAVIARDPRRWKEGIVLAELSEEKFAVSLLRGWNARPLPSEGPVQRYTLANNGLQLARRGRLLLFAPAADPDGLADRTIRLLQSGGSDCLANQPDIRELRARLKPDPDGLIVVSWREDAPSAAAHSATTQSAPRARLRLLAGMHFTPQHLEIDVQRTTDAIAGGPPPRHVPPASLPSDTILLWSGTLDGPAWRREHERGGGGSLWWSALQMARPLLGDNAVGPAAFDRIGPNVAVAVQRAATLPGGDYQAPVLSLWIDAREPPRVAEDFGRLMSVLTAYVNTQLARSGAPHAPLQVERRDANGRTLHVVALGRAMDTYTDCLFLEHIELTWIQTETHLIVSTSAAAALASTDMSVPASARSDSAVTPDQWLHVDGQALANMLQSWLDFARRSAPEALKRSWWIDRARQRARAAERFGVTLRGQATIPPTAVVEEVEPGSPAAAALQRGDVIETVDALPLTSDRPAREVMERFRSRPRDGALLVEFLRDGRHLSRQITLHPTIADPKAVFFPVAVIRPLIALGHAIASIDVTIHDAPPTHRSARILIRWQPPSSQPSTTHPR